MNNFEIDNFALETLMANTDNHLCQGLGRKKLFIYESYGFVQAIYLLGYLIVHFITKLFRLFL